MAETILITGGAGFIGSHLVEYWLFNRPDDHVVVIDALTYAGNLKNLAAAEKSPRFMFIEANILDKDQLAAIFNARKITGVIHLAAETHVDRSISSPTVFSVTNTLGTATLLEACRQYLATHTIPEFKFIQVSTDEVFGSVAAPRRSTAEDIYRPSSPYAASKAGADHLVRAYHHTYDFPALIAYPSNNFGPRQYPEKLIPRVIACAVAKKNIPIFGSGNQSRDWLYVKDNAAALAILYKQGKIGAGYTISAHNDYTNNELIEKIGQIMEQESALPPGQFTELLTRVADRPGHDTRYALAAAKMTAALNWRPTYNFDTALKETVEWYLAHPHWYHE